MKRNIFLMADAPAGGTAVAEPKYSPRTAAADFVGSLPKLGVETPPPADIAPATSPPSEIAPPPTPTPEPPKPTPTPPPVEEKIPRTQKDWESFKAKSKEREAKWQTDLDAAQAKIKELEAKPNPTATDDAKVAALQKEIDDYSERLRMVDVTSHPKFKAYYENKTNAQIELAKRIVGPDKADAMAKALALPDGDFRQAKIEELLSEMTPLQTSRVGAVLNSLNEIEADRAAQIEKSKTDYVTFQEQAKQKAEAQKTESIKKAETMFATVLSTAQNPKDKDGLFIFQKQEGNEEWNKGVEERVKFAKSLLFDTHPPESLMKAALHAAAVPGIVKSYQSLLERNQQLEEQVKGLSTAQPSMQRREATEGGERGGKKPENKRTPFLDGRGQAAGWIKETAEFQTQ